MGMEGLLHVSLHPFLFSSFVCVLICFSFIGVGGMDDVHFLHFSEGIAFFMNSVSCVSCCLC